MTAMLLRIGFLIVVLCSTACSPVFTIEAPLDGEVSVTKPSLFKVAFETGIPDGLQLVLNSTDVTDQFTITELGAEADGVLLADYVFSGKNQFSAVVGNKVVSAIFNFDDVGPTIHILTADHTAGTVSGYLTDPSGPASLTIDGVNIPLDGNNAFDTTFTSQTQNVIVATDVNSDQTTLTYLRSDETLMPSISARLNNGGLAFLAEQIGIGLGDFNFDAMLAMLNPIFDTTLFSADLSNFRFDEPVITFVVQEDERLSLHVELPNFIAAVDADVFLFGNLSGSITVDLVVIDTDAMIDIVNSDIDFSIANTVLDLIGLTVDISHFDTLNSIAENLIGNLLPVIIQLVETLAVPILSEFVGEILVDVDIVTIEDEKLRGLISPTFLNTFNSGLTVDFSASMTAPEPSPEAVSTLGSLFVVGDLPSVGNVSPNGSAFDVGVSISSNLINQALFAAHEAGITTMRLTPANTAGTTPEGVAVIQEPEDDIQTQDLLALKVLPASPPFVKLMEGENLHGLLGWYDVSLEFEMKRVGWADFQTIFETTFNLEVPFELGATDDGFLHIGIEQLPVIEILQFSNSGPIQLSANFINDIVEYAMPVALPNLAAELDSIPLPRVAGYSIHADELWVSGSGFTNFSLAGSLVKLETTEQAIAPTTSLALTTSTVVNVVNGEATVDISEGSNSTAEPLEYRYRVDNGGWSNWKPRSSLRMSRLLGGNHVIEVCSRTILMKQEVSCPTAEFDTSVSQ